ncbi:hypothetical protein GGF43_000860 [Coemansia sp. RSA 2618]|nr:hypothetical protein GGF43_000860 [Coemansia sp. RSA 2618]
MLGLQARLWQTVPRICRHRLLARDFTIAIDGPAASGKSSTARAVAHELGFGYIDSGSIYRCATLLALRQGVSSDAADHSQRLVDLISKAKVDVNILPNTRAPMPGVTGTGRLVVPDVQVLLDGEDVSTEIRTPEVNRLVAKVASDGGVRAAVLDIQRALATAAEAKSTGIREEGSTDTVTIPGGVVMDGRDIGTTVFPGAELKIYLDASAMARAIRRWDEMTSQVKEKKAESACKPDGEASKTDAADAPESVPVGYPSVEDIARELEQRDYADINRQHSPLRIAPDAVVIDNTNMTFEQQVYSITDLARERLGLRRKYDDI